ncbi:MAG: hypothetical protein R6U04_12050 [Bacteroidales bacterium]
MENRKADHLSLALTNQVYASQKDERFRYEPFLQGSRDQEIPPVSIGGKEMKLPIWISSMTGGTKLGGTINHHLARAAAEFGLGMGLGSCSILLKNEKALPDFNLRHIIGNERPFYANMGIAQVEHFLKKDDLKTITDLVNLLDTDGLVIHVNPIQEMMQPEGDRITMPPIETIREFVNNFSGNVIVKEVGQGMGRESLSQLLKIPLTAIEFGALGGTNFAKVELRRNSSETTAHLEPLTFVGHTAEEMTFTLNELITNTKIKNTPNLIISGGIKNFLDGYYLINKSKATAMYGMASALLEYAVEDYEKLRFFLSAQAQGLKTAYTYLKVV